MGNNTSHGAGQSSRATEPGPSNAMFPPDNSSAAAPVVGPAVAAAANEREREAGSGHAGFIAASPAAASVVGPAVAATAYMREREAGSGHAGSTTTSPPAVHVAGPAVAAAAIEREREAGSSRARDGALLPLLAAPRNKRRAEDDEDLNIADAKRARTGESPASIFGGVSRGQKRTAESVADSTALGCSKRRRIEPEGADEEIIRADIPRSARDVILAAQGSALAKFVPVVVPKDKHVPTEGVSFLSLPAEIREMVYQHLLVADKPVVPRVAHRPPHYTVGFPIRTVVSLLLSHRTVYKEALGFILMNNTYKLSIKYHRSWFNLLGRHSTGCLRRVIVECDGRNKHAFDNLTAFQNTLKKRTSPSQFREVTYRFFWAMDTDTCVRALSFPGSRASWKSMKRLERITIQIHHPMTYDFLLELEKRKRVFSRVCLESGRPVRGDVVASLRKNVQHLPFLDVKRKEGWRKFVTIDKTDGDKMVVKDQDWDKVVELTLIPEPAVPEV